MTDNMSGELNAIKSSFCSQKTSAFYYVPLAQISLTVQSSNVCGECIRLRCIFFQTYDFSVNGDLHKSVPL